MLTRVVLPVAVSLIVVAGTISMWRALLRHDMEQVERIAELESYSTRSHLARSSETMIDALRNVRDFWAAFGGLPREQWQSDAYIELDHFKGIDLVLYEESARDIRFLRSTDQPRYDYRPEDAEWDGYRALIDRLHEQDESVMLGPYQYADGNQYLEVYIVSGAGEARRGLVAVINAQEAIGNILVDEAPSYTIEVLWGDEVLYRRGEPASEYPESWIQVGKIGNSLGVVWTVVHRPTQEAVDALKSTATDAILLLGLIIAVLMGFLTHESARARRRALNAETAERELARLNRDQESIIAERTEALELRTHDLQTITDSVGHDLRNPLNAISMNVQLLESQIKRGTVGDNTIKVIERIHPSVHHISAILDRLTGFSALSHETFERERLDMGALFREVIERLSAAEPPPPVSFVIADQLPDAEADRRLVTMLVTNLISNAMKYTREKNERRIEVGYRITKGVTEYFVKDNGIGFDCEKADQLFKAFSRLSGSERFEGSGLGLTIVARVIGRHEGRIWAEGEQGEGATFHFTLEPVRPG